MNLLISKSTLSFYSNKSINFLGFYRFDWVSNYLRSVKFGMNFLIVTLEPSLDDDSLKLCFCEGTFVSASFNLNSVSVTLRQAFGSVFVNRIFFLNSNNFIYLKSWN